MSARPVLPSTKSKSVGTPKCPQLAPRRPNFAAQWPARMYPCRRFALVPANDDARLGASAVRYAFTVGLFHFIQLAGFDRRTAFLDTTGSGERTNLRQHTGRGRKRRSRLSGKARRIAQVLPSRSRMNGRDGILAPDARTLRYPLTIVDRRPARPERSRMDCNRLPRRAGRPPRRRFRLGRRRTPWGRLRCFAGWDWKACSRR